MRYNHEIFLALLLCLVSMLSFSQNYRVLVPGKEYIYKNLNWGGVDEDIRACGTDSYIGLKADSFKVSESDTVFYHFTIVRNTSDNLPDCYNVYQEYPNWIGSRTVVKAGVECIFLNLKGDSIRLKPQANVGDKWKLFEYVNGDYFEAEITEKVKGSVLTAEDSIKIIVISLKDNLGGSLNHDFNGKEIHLSKNYGLIRGYDFSRFPVDTSQFIMYGISEPEMGVQNLIARKVFDYGIGDEFHIDEAHSFVPYNGTFKKERRIILEKSISSNQDTLFYKVERLLVTHNHNYQEQTHDSSIVKDTIEEKIILSEYEYINVFPIKFDYLNWDGSAKMDVYCQSNSLYNSRLKKAVGVDFLHADDAPCYSPVIYGGGPDYHYYLEGLGTYYEGDEFPSQNHKRLVYFKKGSETWGAPINFDLLLFIQKKQELQISAIVAPNPFTNYTVLKIQNPANQLHHLKLMDPAGKLLREYSFAGEELIIQKDELPKGVYIYKITSDNNRVGEGKLVIY